MLDRLKLALRRQARRLQTLRLWLREILAGQIEKSIVSKGQLPAEADIRRGQYYAVHQIRIEVVEVD